LNSLLGSGNWKGPAAQKMSIRINIGFCCYRAGSNHTPLETERFCVG
jgi:hypothetical protein